MTGRKPIIAILCLFLVVRLWDLGGDISNTDALRWHSRSQDFLLAIKSGDFKSTYQHYQPGVTLMWLNSFVKQASFSVQYHVLGREAPLTTENADWYPVIHGLSKGCLVLVLAGLLLWQIKLINRLFSRQAALVYGFFMAVEPYMIGQDRWFHLTSLEAYLAFTAWLLLIDWHKDHQEKKLALAGIIFSLSVLTKFTAILILPLVLFIILAVSFERKMAKEKVMKSLAIFFLFFSLTTALVFPAVLVDFGYVVGKVSNAAKNVVLVENQGIKLGFPLEALFYILVLLYKLSPVTLVLFLGFLINYKKYHKNKETRYIIAYTLFYFLTLSLAQKKIDRYALALFPPLILLASLFWADQSTKIKKIFTGLGLGFLLLVIFIYHPVYSAYYSPLLGGTQTAHRIGFYDNSGEYFAQAAFYLNLKSRQTSVFVPHSDVSFFSYFKGVRVNSLEEKPDYLVVSLDTDRQADGGSCSKLEKTFGSREAKIVYVYKCE